jgi:Mn-containing catalase
MAAEDLLMDIGTEEVSHLDFIGALARMHLSPMRKSADAAEHDTISEFLLFPRRRRSGIRPTNGNADLAFPTG